MNAAADFRRWAEEWLALGTYAGANVPNAAERIDAILDLWRQPVPAGWERGDDPALLDPAVRYRRSHPGRPDGPVSEARIESEVLDWLPTSRCFGDPVVDGVNAIS